MSEFVKCGRCGTVYDLRCTHGTTVVNGYCPMCGLHHSGTHSIVYPVLKPSPLAATPISERMCRNVSDPPEGFLCSECGWGDFAEPSHLLTGSCYDGLAKGPRYCPNCGARVVSECIAESHDCGDGVTGLYCSECGNYIDENDNYCPTCGAKVVK